MNVIECLRANENAYSIQKPQSVVYLTIMVIEMSQRAPPIRFKLRKLSQQYHDGKKLTISKTTSSKQSQ